MRSCDRLSQKHVQLGYSNGSNLNYETVVKIYEQFYNILESNFAYRMRFTQILKIYLAWRCVEPKDIMLRYWIFLLYDLSKSPKRYITNFNGTNDEFEEI